MYSWRSGCSCGGGCTSGGGCVRHDGCTRDQVVEFVLVGIRVSVGVLAVVAAFGGYVVESLGKRNTSHAFMLKAGG